MRRLGLFLTTVIVLLTGCSKEPDNGSNNNGTKGGITLSLSAKDDHEIVVPVKSTVESSIVPPIDSFKIEIFDESGVRIYRNKYEKTKSETIYLNGGKHKLLASHGKALGVGFDAIYFAAEEPFTINGQDIVPVTAVAKMANVKAAVNFGENLKAGYSEYYARLKCPAKTKHYLEFQKNETRPGYIPAGELVFELYAKINGEWKYYPLKPMTYNPNEFVTFNVDTDPLELDMNIDITIDNTVEEIKKEFNVPAEAMPAFAPTISLSGSFDAEGNFKFIHGKNYEGTQIDILADGGIKTCIIEITSDYYTSLGLPTSIDLANPNAEGLDILSNSGIKWIKGMAGQHFGAINFADLSNKITFDSGKPFSAQVKVTVTDNNNKEIVSGTYNLIHLPEITFAPQPYNAFAKRVAGLTAEVVSGNPSSVGIQWSMDKKIWNDATVAEISGKNVKFNAISGLRPTTTYYFRTIYNNDENFTSAPVALTTEVDAQIGNAGFEEWTTNVLKYDTTFSNGTCDWYLPYSSPESSWWAVNSLKTMRSWCSSGTPGIGDNFNIKNFPTVSYYSNGNNKLAQIATIVTGKSATNNGPGTVEVTKAAGELWIGTANYEGDWSNGGGDHLTDGHTFDSRPSAISFYYQYLPYQNETFYVKIEFKDKDGISFYSKEITDGPAENTGKVMTVPIEYTDITKKAASIYLSFKSSSAPDPAYQKTSITMPNGDQTALVGSVLRIDDITLIYE